MFDFFLELQFSLASVGGFVVVIFTKKEERDSFQKALMLKENNGQKQY